MKDNKNYVPTYTTFTSTDNASFRGLPKESVHEDPKLFVEIYRKCLSQGRCARVSLRPGSDAKLSMSRT